MTKRPGRSGQCYRGRASRDRAPVQSRRACGLLRLARPLQRGRAGDTRHPGRPVGEDDRGTEGVCVAPEGAARVAVAKSSGNRNGMWSIYPFADPTNNHRIRIPTSTFCVCDVDLDMAPRVTDWDVRAAPADRRAGQGRDGGGTSDHDACRYSSAPTHSDNF